MGRRHRRKSKGLDQPAARAPLRQRNQRKVLAASEERRQESASDSRRRAATKQGRSNGSQRFQLICPDCRTPLAAGNYQGGNCGSKFKGEKDLAWLAVLVPGGGF